MLLYGHQSTRPEVVFGYTPRTVCEAMLEATHRCRPPKVTDLLPMCDALLWRISKEEPGATIDKSIQRAFFLYTAGAPVELSSGSGGDPACATVVPHALN